MPVSDATAGGRFDPACVPTRLIDAAKRGDQAAFTALYRAYAPPLQRYLDAVAGPLALDVAGATWESVTTSLARFRGDGEQFRRWLFTIARRRLVDEIRSASRRPLAVAEPPDVAVCDGHDEPDGPEWAVDVLRRIPTRQADVVALRVVGGLSVGEVADLLGITPENVRVLSHRGLRAVQALLAPSVAPSTDAREEEFLSVV